MHYFVVILVICNHPEEEEKARYFVIIVLQMYCYYINVLWIFLSMPWVGLQRLIVIFADHAHLLFGYSIEQISNKHCVHGRQDCLRGVVLMSTHNSYTGHRCEKYKKWGHLLSVYERLTSL